MEKHFVTYEQAVTLKEMGFDEPCFAIWDNQSKELFMNDVNILVKEIPTILTPAALWQQAFRWFREKQGLTWEYQFDDSNILLYVGEIAYPDNNLDFFKLIEVDYDKYNDAYEKAESECLDKLIELAKSKKK